MAYEVICDFCKSRIGLGARVHIKPEVLGLPLPLNKVMCLTCYQKAVAYLCAENKKSVDSKSKIEDTIDKGGIK